MREHIDNYFLRIVEVVGSRGTCDRGRSGCIIVKDKNIISTGYVGAPHGLDHCDDVGHLIIDNHCIRSTHAEQNAIINAAKNGVKLNGATLYCTMIYEFPEGDN
jgi:dCMP deaminase